MTRPRPPKISFLIPSKNRLELLRHAVYSILWQDDPDIEIVISDNCSEQDYAAFVESLGESRIVYHRQSVGVPVTENWQAALARSSGDWILMLGDDDALAPNFTHLVRQHLTEAHDVVYLAAYHYCYPRVLQGQPAGYLASVRNSEFLRHDPGPFCLVPGYARELAGSVLDFRSRFGINAQHYVIKAAFAKQFAGGGIFQSPYPDTFAAILVMMRARAIVVMPTEAVIIGISPKSFGYFYFSGRHSEGYEMLAIAGVSQDIRDSIGSVMLPGDPNNTHWLVSAETARRYVARLAAGPAGADRVAAATGDPGLSDDRALMARVAAALRAIMEDGSASRIEACLAELWPVVPALLRPIFELLLITIALLAARHPAILRRAVGAAEPVLRAAGLPAATMSARLRRAVGRITPRRRRCAAAVVPPARESRSGADRLNIGRYRALQMVAVLRNRHDTRRRNDIAALNDRLSPLERLVFGLLDALCAVAARSDRAALVDILAACERRLELFTPAEVKFLDLGAHKSILDAYNRLVTAADGASGDRVEASPLSR
jgi:glycosyltransferase involved in cell wall biosynthesis